APAPVAAPAYRPATYQAPAQTQLINLGSGGSSQEAAPAPQYRIEYRPAVERTEPLKITIDKPQVSTYEVVLLKLNENPMFNDKLEVLNVVEQSAVGEANLSDADNGSKEKAATVADQDSDNEEGGNEGAQEGGQENPGGDFNQNVD
ncbi:MAG: hypothetical protein K1X44_05440, partial [Alphaproteobacteria bacterium]|nr:hypothetical protein [Alphaproteobacteria bacterium]